METYSLTVKGNLKDRLIEMNERGDFWSAFTFSNKVCFGEEEDGQKICDLVQDKNTCLLLRPDLYMVVNFVKHGKLGQKLIPKKYISWKPYFMKAGFREDIPEELKKEFKTISKYEKEATFEMISFYLVPNHVGGLRFNLAQAVQVDYHMKSGKEFYDAFCSSTGLRTIYGAGIVKEIENSGTINNKLDITMKIKEELKNRQWYDNLFTQVALELSMTKEELRQYRSDEADFPPQNCDPKYWNA